MEKMFSVTSCLSRVDIEQYLAEDLSKERRFEVENHLLDCPLCSAAVEGLEGIDSEGVMNLAELYENLEERLSEPAEPATVKRMIPWNRIVAAAMLLLTVGAAWIYYQKTNEQSYLAYFEDAIGTSTTRGLDRELLTEDIIAGVRLYEKENYEGSLSFFEDYLETEQSALANYYAGLSALETGDLGLSEEYLKTARMNNDDLYESATWFLIKVYLERGNEKEAMDLLKDLTKIENGFYAERAQNLLKEIQ
jgi:tetratricopeptide (TPR) repeat protein